MQRFCPTLYKPCVLLFIPRKMKTMDVQARKTYIWKLQNPNCCCFFSFNFLVLYALELITYRLHSSRQRLSQKPWFLLWVQKTGRYICGGTLQFMLTVGRLFVLYTLNKLYWKYNRINRWNMLLRRKIAFWLRILPQDKTASNHTGSTLDLSLDPNLCK